MCSSVQKATRLLWSSLRRRWTRRCLSSWSSSAWPRPGGQCSVAILGSRLIRVHCHLGSLSKARKQWWWPGPWNGLQQIDGGSSRPSFHGYLGCSHNRWKLKSLSMSRRKCNMPSTTSESFPYPFALCNCVLQPCTVLGKKLLPGSHSESGLLAGMISRSGRRVQLLPSHCEKRQKQWKQKLMSLSSRTEPGNLLGRQMPDVASSFWTWQPLWFEEPLHHGGWCFLDIDIVYKFIMNSSEISCFIGHWRIHDRLEPCPKLFILARTFIGGIPDADHVHAWDSLSSAKLERLERWPREISIIPYHHTVKLCKCWACITIVSIQSFQAVLNPAEDSYPDQDRGVILASSSVCRLQDQGWILCIQLGMCRFSMEGYFFLFRFGHFFDFCFPASLLFCFSAFCFSLFPWFCFSAFCFSAFLPFPASLVLCFFAFLLLCFSAFSTVLLLRCFLFFLLLKPE